MYQLRLNEFYMLALGGSDSQDKREYLISCYQMIWPLQCPRVEGADIILAKGP